jgi:hypothetical protein
MWVHKQQVLAVFGGNTSSCFNRSIQKNMMVLLGQQVETLNTCKIEDLAGSGIQTAGFIWRLFTSTSILAVSRKI